MGYVFTDIDECSRNTDNCNETSTSCQNFQGGYECPCKSGFKHKQGDSYNCDCEYHISDGPVGLIFLLSVECNSEFNWMS